MTYRKQGLPIEYSASAVEREFERVEQALQEFEVMQLQQRHTAPEKPRAGMVALADGTNWNPGAGAGFYGYYGGAWVKLG